MISKTKISKRIKNKKDSHIVETIFEAKKHRNWFKVAQLISGPKRKYVSGNLGKIDSKIEDGKIIVVPGKVVGNAKLTKKAKIYALAFSETAREELSKSKIEFGDILEQIKKNPSAKDVVIYNG